jgi:hypothetical protein
LRPLASKTFIWRRSQELICQRYLNPFPLSCGNKAIYKTIDKHIL